MDLSSDLDPTGAGRGGRRGRDSGGGKGKNRETGIASFGGTLHRPPRSKYSTAPPSRLQALLLLLQWICSSDDVTITTAKGDVSSGTAASAVAAAATAAAAAVPAALLTTSNVLSGWESLRNGRRRLTG